MQIRSIVGSIVLCTAFVFISAPVHGGPWLLLAAPFLAVWLPYSAYVIWRRPDARRIQAIKVSLWVVAVGGVLLTQWHYQKAARESANSAVAEIFRYKASRGSFPADLNAINFKDQKTWRLAYLVKDGKPSLFYPATFTLFDTYWYDFEHKSWVYQPD
jgi:hypothetical protein